MSLPGTNTRNIHNWPRLVWPKGARTLLDGVLLWCRCFLCWGNSFKVCFKGSQGPEESHPWSGFPVGEKPSCIINTGTIRNPCTITTSTVDEHRGVPFHLGRCRALKHRSRILTPAGFGPPGAWGCLRRSITTWPLGRSPPRVSQNPLEDGDPLPPNRMSGPRQTERGLNEYPTRSHQNPHVAFAPRIVLFMLEATLLSEGVNLLCSASLAQPCWQ